MRDREAAGNVPLVRGYAKRMEGVRYAEKMVKQVEGRADTLSVAVEKSTTYMNKAGNRETDMREDRSEIVGRRSTCVQKKKRDVESYLHVSDESCVGV